MYIQIQILPCMLCGMLPKETQPESRRNDLRTRYLSSTSFEKAVNPFIFTEGLVCNFLRHRSPSSPRMVAVWHLLSLKLQ